MAHAQEIFRLNQAAGNRAESGVARLTLAICGIIPGVAFRAGRKSIAAALMLKRHYSAAVPNGRRHADAVQAGIIQASRLARRESADNTDRDRPGHGVYAMGNK